MRWKRDSHRQNSGVLNLYVDKPFVQSINHFHSTKQKKEKNRSIDCICLQWIDSLFSLLVEWQCSFT